MRVCNTAATVDLRADFSVCRQESRSKPRTALSHDRKHSL